MAKFNYGNAYLYNTWTTASSTSGTVNVTYFDDRTPARKKTSARKKTLLELLDERVEGVCAIGRERLAA